MSAHELKHELEGDLVLAPLEVIRRDPAETEVQGAPESRPYSTQYETTA